jgi:hypothetical protein
MASASRSFPCRFSGETFLMGGHTDAMGTDQAQKAPLRTDPESHQKSQPSAYSDYAVWLI